MTADLKYRTISVCEKCQLASIKNRKLFVFLDRKLGFQFTSIISELSNPHSTLEATIS